MTTGGRRSLATLLSLGMILSACGDDEGTPHGSGGSRGDAACPAEDPVCACPAGFEQTDAGCSEIAATDCGPGTRPALGSTECLSVGWVGPCPDGMEPDPSGWACRAVVPAAACEGATTERLGQPSCVPIGDCGAPFPPGTATLFVDDDYGPGELDATHFARVADAVSAAPSGAVIAVESGTYLEGFDAIRPVTVVGRCAAEVVLRNPGDGFGGVQVQGVDGVHLAGLTLEGHAGGVVFLDSVATVDDCLLLDNRGAGAVIFGSSTVQIRRSRIAGSVQKSPSGQWGYGALVQLGADVTIEDSSLAGNRVAGLQLESPGTVVRLRRTVIRGSLPAEIGDNAGTRGVGVAVLDRALLEVDESFIAENRHSGVHVEGAGSHASVSNTVISAIATEVDGTFGGGLQVVDAGSAEITDSLVSECAGYGLGVGLAGSSLSAARVTVRGSLPFSVDRTGVGLVVAEQAVFVGDDIALVGNRDAGVLTQDVGTSATLSRILVRDTELGVGKVHGDGVGISVNLGSALVLEDAAVVNNRLVGIAVRSIDPTGAASQAIARRVLVTDTLAATDGSFGHGLHVTDGGSLTFEDGSVSRSRKIGAVADKGATLSLTNAVVRATTLDDLGGFGYGVLGLRGSTVTVTATTIRDHEGAALLFSESTGGIFRSVVASSAIAVQAQDGTAIAELDALPSPLVPLTASFSETRFVDNGTRVGAGALPLPSALE